MGERGDREDEIDGDGGVPHRDLFMIHASGRKGGESIEGT